MKENIPKPLSTSSLPPIAHPSISKLPQQHKLDSLLKDITHTTATSTTIKSFICDKGKKQTDGKGKTLLRSVNGMSRTGLKSRFEVAENGLTNRLQSLKGKGDEITKINLTSVSCMAPTVETESVRVSAKIIETDLPDFSTQNQPQQLCQSFQNGLDGFLALHLTSGVTFKSL